MEEDLERERLELEKRRQTEIPDKPPLHVPSHLIPWQTKFTEDRRKSVLGALVGNHYPSTAAALAGIGIGTLNSWLRQGRLDEESGIDTEYSLFLMQYEQAAAIGEQKALGTVTKASDRGDVRAATFILERRYGKGKWEKTDRLEVGGDASQPIVVELKWPGQREGLVPDPAAAPALPAAEDEDIVDGELVEPDDMPDSDAAAG